jgi:hypothetical protein
MSTLSSILLPFTGQTVIADLAITCDSHSDFNATGFVELEVHPTCLTTLFQGKQWPNSPFLEAQSHHTAQIDTSCQLFKVEIKSINGATLTPPHITKVEIHRESVGTMRF